MRSASIGHQGRKAVITAAVSRICAFVSDTGNSDTDISDNRLDFNSVVREITAYGAEKYAGSRRLFGIGRMSVNDEVHTRRETNGVAAGEFQIINSFYVLQDDVIERSMEAYPVDLGSARCSV